MLILLGNDSEFFWFMVLFNYFIVVGLSQVTRSVDTERGKLSPQEQKTVEAIVQAR